MRRHSRVAGLVLAAGGSRRLGRPKQLVSIDGMPLVRRAALRALESTCEEVFVVLGARRREVRRALAGLDLTLIENPGWRAGMGSSIRLGLFALQRRCPAPTGILIISVDQYLVDCRHLDRLRRAHDDGHDLVASSYAATLGIPALFSQRYFSELAALDPAGGAKSMIARRRERILAVPCPQGDVDLDTLDDLQAVSRQTSA